jgi:hypothetical protein
VGGLHATVTLDKGKDCVLFALAGEATFLGSGTATDERLVRFNNPATFT